MEGSLRKLKWAELVASEPRLLGLWGRARRCGQLGEAWARRRCWCRAKGQLDDLVGLWADGPPEVRTVAAYDEAYEVLAEAAGV